MRVLVAAVNDATSRQVECDAVRAAGIVARLRNGLFFGLERFALLRWKPQVVFAAKVVGLVVYGVEDRGPPSQHRRARGLAQ